MTMNHETGAARVKAVYAVMARADGREVRLRLGSAFANHDGSLSVLLDALPTNGRLHICDYQPHGRAAPRASARGAV
jgi:hypothetical protein